MQFQDFKAAILVGINAADKKAAMNALRDKMIEKKLPWPHKENPLCYIMDKIDEVHKPIAHKICSDAGTRLMRLDSDIMNNILMNLMEKGICGLSVHDSVIVAERQRDTLYQVMMEEYKKIMGFYPVIAKKVIGSLTLTFSCTGNDKCLPSPQPITSSEIFRIRYSYTYHSFHW